MTTRSESEDCEVETEQGGEVLPSPAAPKAIVGLGNPGAAYSGSRHNCGFWVIDELARRWRLTLIEGACRSRMARNPRALLVQPQTFMNRSGYTVRCLAEKWHQQPQDFLIVFDDVELPLGALRMRTAGSPGGHRGLESVLENLRTEEVPRLRIGIKPESSAAIHGETSSESGSADRASPGAGRSLADFVLSPFDSSEEAVIRAEITRAADACEAWLEHGAEHAMSRFNGFSRPRPGASAAE